MEMLLLSGRRSVILEASGEALTPFPPPTDLRPGSQFRSDDWAVLTMGEGNHITTVSVKRKLATSA
jgi:hypothetical protein